MNKRFTLDGWKIMCCLLFGALFFSTSLTAQTALATRSITNTVRCDNGNPYNGAGTNYGLYIQITGEDPFHTLQWGTLSEYSDGTAILIGNVVNNSNPAISFNVDVTFTGRTFTPPAGSPKAHDCFNPNSTGWYYYTGLTGILTGVGSSWGTMIDITGSVGPAFQVGYGANVTNNGTSFGGSGWLSLNVAAQGPWGPQITLNTNTSGTNGDININLSGAPLVGTPIGGCSNVTNGGSIGGTQTVCAGTATTILTNNTAPSGGSGGLEYLWLSSTSSCPTSTTQAIPGATGATYNPGALSQTTYFVRCARRAGCTSWSAGESNCIIVTVDSTPGCGNTCSNVTSGGSIGGTQTVCSGTAATTLTNTTAPSGGSGAIQYLWLSSTSGCPTSVSQAISGASGATYNPGVLNQTTYFVRCARRAGCTSWSAGESNCIVVTVDSSPWCGDTCNNVTNGGLIGGTQTVCAGDAATILTSTTVPSGGYGGIQYQWLSSTSGCPTSVSQEIPGATSATYNPGVLNQTTYFVRCARRVGCTSWIPGESNCIKVTVNYTPGCGNTCSNVTNGGTIGGAQIICAGDAATTLTSTVAPTGGSGGLEYLWLSATNTCPSLVSQAIPGATGATYNPGVLNQTTYFVRCSRRVGCTSWIPGESNCIAVTVDTAPNCGVICDNVATGGTIGGAQTVCAGDAATVLTNTTAPSGGSGGLEYLWLSSTTSCPTSVSQAIPGATGATYNPGVLNQTTYFVRCARRVGCTSWGLGESNCITVTVDSSPSCGGGGGSPDCSDVTVTSGTGSILIGGLDGAPIVSVQVFTSSWQGVYDCFNNCDSPIATIPASNGDYIVYVKYYSAGYAFLCEVNETITVGGGGGCTDNDNDGTCAADDCNDYDPSVPAAVGSTCNDGNAGTINDEIQADGCTCAGTPVGCTDNDNDGTCAADDCNDNDPSIPATVGSTCDDGNANTINDVIQANGCTCAGTPSGGGNGVDLAVTINGDGAQVGPYESFSVDVVVTNEGTTTSNNVVVNVPQPANVVFQGSGSHSTTQGSYDNYSTFNWSVGTLAPGQSETLTVNYFSLAGAPYTVYAQVQSASGTDIDSTPGNGTNPNPNEDDEDVYVTGGGGGGNNSCPLNLTASVAGITCNDNGTPNNTSDDTFTFNVTVSGGNPWGWTGGGTTGAMDQAVNFGPYLISSGNVGFTIIDNDNATCTVAVDVTPPATCSTGGGGGGGGGTPDCSDITVTTGNGTITLGGLDGAPIVSVQVFTSDWSQTIVNCFDDCDTPTQIVTVPSAGDYIVYVKYYTAGYEFVCQYNETITVGGGGGPTGDLSISCPTNVNVTAAVGANSAIVYYSAATASSTCTVGVGTVQRIAGPASGTAFPLGTTTVTYQAEDACGNVETCSFTITVAQAAPPTGILSISCPTNISITAASGANSATVYYSAATASSTCPVGVVVVQRTAGPVSGTAFPVGTTTVTYQAEDGCGNVETCSFTVTVAPGGPTGDLSLTCPNNINIATEPGGNSGLIIYPLPNVYSSCTAGGLSLQRIAGPASGTIFPVGPVGTTTVTYQAQDNCGNVETCSFTITLTVTPPLTCTQTQLAYYSMNACVSCDNGSNLDWSELTPVVGNPASCLGVNASTVRPASGSAHSCTPGASGNSMCIGQGTSIEFDVTLSTLTGGSLGKISFYEQAPNSYYWYTAGCFARSGTNNRPTKFDMDIYKGGVLVYTKTFTTQASWNQRVVDLSNDPDFDFQGTGTYTFRFTPYNAQGWGNVRAWDIDEVRIYGCCFGQNFDDGGPYELNTVNTGNNEVEQEHEHDHEADERTEGEEEITSYSFEINPNPATTSVNLSLEGANGADVVINVYDQLGRLVERAEADSSLESSYRINTADYNAGLYLIRVQAGDEPAITKQLVILPH